MAYKISVQEASIRLVALLFEIGYIDDKERIWLIHRIKSGDSTGYRDLKRKLEKILDLIGRM